MSRAAGKLRERMMGTQVGWGERDLDRLLMGHGFRSREGPKHRIYEHQEHPDLTIAVPRHKSLRAWVVRDALRLLQEVDRRAKHEES